MVNLVEVRALDGKTVPGLFDMIDVKKRGFFCEGSRWSDGLRQTVRRCFAPLPVTA
jgi:hypothetical protein